MAGYTIVVVAVDGTRHEYPATDADDARQVRFAASCLHPRGVVTIVTGSPARRRQPSGRT